MAITTLPRNMFLWSMSVIYMFAFASLYIQIPGLYGNDGVLPVRSVDPGAADGAPLLEQLHASPSLLWVVPGLGAELDRQQAAELLCLLGALLALGAAVLEAFRDSLVFLLLWALYLSLCQVGQAFLHFPWDGLLLEAGFLTVVIAPLTRWRSPFRHHDAVTFWLARWLLFRVTFGSGVAKLAGHCPSWWGLTAVSHLLETQGSPTPLAWFASQLPDWLLSLGTVGVLVSEVAVPVLFFAPLRCLRLGAFYFQVAYQVTCMLTGNLTLLHLLVLALSFSLLDDEAVSAWLGHAKKKRAKSTWGQSLVSWLTLLTALGVYVLILYCTKVLFQLEVNWEAMTVSSKTAFSQYQFGELLKLVTWPSVWLGVLSLTWELVGSMLGCACVKGWFWKLWALLQWAVFAAAAAALFALSVVPYTSLEPASSSRVHPEVRSAYSLVQRYRLVGSYALHSAVSAEGRPEVILEGSMDNSTWTEMELMYKPGSVAASPALTGPYLPRLDWALWQAAAGPQEHSPWFTGLVHRLLQGKRHVVSLIQADEALYPFSQSPPAFIRASLYRYHFTRPQKDGSIPPQWWTRQYVAEFYPRVHLGDPKLEGMLSQHGLKDESPVQPSPDGLLAQVLLHVRGHVEALSGPAVLWSLCATVVCICLLKTLLAGRVAQKAAPTETPSAAATGAGHKVRKENSNERRRDSDKPPRKRK